MACDMPGKPIERLLDERPMGNCGRPRVEARKPGGALPVRFFIGDLLVASPAAAVSVREFRAQIDSTADGRRAHVTFRTAEMAKDAEPLALTIVRGSAKEAWQ